MFRKITAILLVCVFAAPFAMAAEGMQNTTPAQNAKPNPQQPASTPATPPTTQGVISPPLTGFGIEDGTPVKLRIARTVSSADAKVGETVDFEVLEEVKVGNTVVIPKSGIAWATVTEAQSKRRMGRGGKLNMNIDSVRLVNGQKVPLRAVKDVQGGGHVGAMTGAIVATSIVFFPAAPFFLFMHGKDITIPKGTEITAYINGNTPLDEAQFLPKDKQATVTAVAATSGDTELAISSTPDNADIEIDGAFSGNTPSTVNVPAGDHTIVVKKKGFQNWERKIKASGGHINIKAEMEAAAEPKVPETAPVTAPVKDGIQIQVH